MKKRFFMVPIILGLLLLTACSSDEAADKKSSKEKNPNKQKQEALKISMVIPGNIKDKGFMESGYNGLMKIKNDLGAKVDYIDKIKPEKQSMTNALEQLAKKQPDMIIMHGGQGSEATESVAKKYPDIQFVVTQGHVKGSNLSSFEVLQEESAYLAGAAAGLLTKSETVGHMSGIRVVPGLKGRAAFADGLKQTNPEAKLLTSFIGDQDDNALSKKYAEAQVEKGADIIFTMLNSGREGVTEVLKAKKLKHIGNVKDYVKEDPQVFIASAVADSGMAGFIAAEKLKNGTYKPNVNEQIGLENSKAVRLSLSPDVPKSVKDKIDNLKKKIESGEIKVKVDYDGPEFKLEK
ncbi:BMP family protein [Aciduricibacillus chroicocephali]|uniref:BMP family protein n=1 Tax=Aciduricibacillus chroicocephali TaxID=3054939 RepID=A0ABY9KTI4_9BACI|nr:BMP family protein [Bacillaceae bacterium 44XB]